MVTISMKVILNLGKKKPTVDKNNASNGVIERNGNREFHQLAIQAIAEERLYRRSSTVNNYITALRSFIGFAGEHLLLDDFNQQLIEQYQQFLKSKGICLNTISCYMRSLRVIYKKTMGGNSNVNANPFNNVFLGKTKTRKRSIANDEILRIQQLELPSGSYLRLCRDTMLFSFYALGMPFVDIAHLQHSQIIDNTIFYYRQKTMQPVHIKIEPCIRKIIDYYYNPQRRYIFPFITADDNITANRQYHTSLGRYNRTLKRIARMAGVTSNITSYTMRHTWATLAFRNNIDLPIISKALGHTNTNTTITYIREIDDAPIAEANRKLLEMLHLVTEPTDK
ncbi:MAG: site-specific integrase [Prevotella sp.]|nr:site-specific integrase [Prevotella sp.]